MTNETEKGKLVLPEITYEYIIVGDVTSEVILSTPSRAKVKDLVAMIRASGGQVSVFRSTTI